MPGRRSSLARFIVKSSESHRIFFKYDTIGVGTLAEVTGYMIISIYVECLCGFRRVVGSSVHARSEAVLHFDEVVLNDSMPY